MAKDDTRAVKAEIANILVTAPAPLPKLSLTQGEAVAILAVLPVGGRHVFGKGKYNVALRALMLREPDFVSREVETDGKESWALRYGRS